MAHEKQGWSRRGLLGAGTAALVGAGGLATATQTLAEAAARKSPRIVDVRTMELQGPVRTYVFVKIIADDGQFGIAEGYGKPNVGLIDQVESLKPWLVGRNPLEIEKIYQFLGDGSKALSGTMTDGSAHSQMNLASVIDMALWDLAGKILNVSTTELLGGKFRDKVRVLDHSGPKDMLDKASCREWAAQANAHPSGFTAHKMGMPRAVMPGSAEKGWPDVDHDPSNLELTTKELMMIGQGFENAREAIGWDHDIIVHCHWELNLRSSIELAKILEPVRPLWLEDPLQVDYTDSWKRLVDVSPIPILTGENQVRLQEFLPFIVNSAIDLIQPDLRNTGGFSETKRIAELASVYGIPTCNHNTGSPLNTIQTCQWAGAMRNYLICETSTGDGNWIDGVVVHEDGPYIEKGYIKVNDRPGTGVKLNREVVEAHLVTGSKWWGDA